MIPLIEPRILPGWIWAAVTVGLMAGAAVAGYRTAAAQGEAAVAECQRSRETDARAAAEEAARRLAASQKAEAAAVHALHATRQRLAATEKRLKESLYALPSAQSCGLSGPARGLLNARISAADGDRVPARAAEPDRTDAGAVADSGQPVHEADLGAWIADVIGRYDECRARLDAIRQWDEVTHGR